MTAFAFIQGIACLVVAVTNLDKIGLVIVFGFFFITNCAMAVYVLMSFAATGDAFEAAVNDLDTPRLEKAAVALLGIDYGGHLKRLTESRRMGFVFGGEVVTTRGVIKLVAAFIMSIAIGVITSGVITSGAAA